MKAKAKVLIVEDELIIGKNIERYLGHLGYDVIDVCSSSEEVLEVVGEEMPDLVLMDINIEGSEDGVSLADRLHRDYQLPVVFLSALMDEETLERAKISQPFGYIVKPFSQRELHIALEIALYKAEVERRIKDQEVMLQALIDTMKQGFCLLDQQGRIVYANRELTRLLAGAKDPTVLGKDLDALLWPPGLLRSHLQHDDPVAFDAQLPGPDGQSHQLIVTPQLIRHDDGRPRGAFVSLTFTGAQGND